MPGRLQVVGEDPLTVLDGAHNPDATRALVQALPEVSDARPPRPLGLVLGVLEDKDAASMLAALLPVCERAWFTAPPGSRALSPAALQSLARQLGFHAADRDRSEISSSRGARSPTHSTGRASAARERRCSRPARSISSAIC